MQVLPSGDQLGRYRIDRVLDAGPDVVTYAADDPRLRRTVVLSVVSPGATGSADRTAELRAAATRLSGLSSPYVAQVHDHEVEGDRVYVVSQYVPGGDLATWLTQHGPLPRHHALRIAEQVAAGLADAHRHGVTHDGLGPRNVLVRDPGSDRAHAWVADFPLVDADRGSVDGDLRSVGRVLLAALTGADPGPAAPPPPPGSFGNVDSLLARLLGPDPATRSADAGALRAELADLARREAPPAAPATAIRPAVPATAVRPVVAPPPPYVAPTAAAPPRRRARVLALVAAAVALVVVGGGTTWLLSDRNSDDTGGSTTTDDAPVTGDIDGDGRGDVLLRGFDNEAFGWTDQILFLRTGDGGVAETVVESYPDGVDPADQADLHLADVDGDGALDRVFATTFAPTSETLVIDVVPAEGEPWHQEIPYAATPWGAADAVQVLFGDLDRDGRADLVVANEYLTDGFSVFVGSAGDGAFADPEEWYAAGTEASLAQLDIADFDGDGEHDVLASLEGPADDSADAPWSIELQLLASDGSALSAAGDPRPLGPGNYPQGVRLYGDLDGDGSDEPVLVGPDGFATTSFTEGAAPDVVPVWEVDPANQAWQARYERYSSVASADWVMSDVDGDGDDDLVFLQFRGDEDSRPVTVRLAEDGQLGDPTPWGSFDCGTACGPVFDYRPVTPAY